jgi:ATP-dependent Clp protease ATP-binding subunit ClpC
MFERFTERARQTVVCAQENARRLKHNYIGTEHIVLGVLEEAEGMGAKTLIHLGLTYESALSGVRKAIGDGPADAEIPVQQLPFTPRARKVYELALREALSLGCNYIGTEHVLLGLVRENEGVGARVLREAGIDSEAVRDEIIFRLSGGGKRAPKPDPAVVALDLMRIGDKLQSEASRVAEYLKGEKLPYEVAQAVFEIDAAVKEWTDTRRTMVVQRAA